MTRSWAAKVERELGASKLRVKVVLYVEVDKDVVEREYGEKQSAAGVREWVRGEAQSATESALTQVGAVVRLP